MIYCKQPSCNTGNLDTANYCIACGECLVNPHDLNIAELRANHSEHKNSKKAKFCIYCGILLEGTVPPPQPKHTENNNDKEGIEKWEPYLIALQDYPEKGDNYKGEIKDGKPHGKGIILYQNGDWREGNFVEGKVNGFGTFYSVENERKDFGEYKNGAREGKGKIEFENSVYEGEWNNKGAHGRGVVKIRKKNQDGVFVFTGEKKDGFFVDHIFKRGKWTYENGNYEEGSFDEDYNLHGIGSYFSYKNKRLETGEYSHGERIGKGCIQWFETGSIWEGFWDDYGIIEGTVSTKKGNVIPYFNLFSLYRYLHKCLTQEHTAEELDLAVTRFLKKTNADKKTTTFDDGNLIKGCIEYLYNEAPEDEQNVFMIAELINAGIKREGHEEYESDLDRLFAMLEEKDENHIALKYYIDFFDATAEQGNSIFEICRNRFSTIGNPDNVFEYAKDKDDVEMLAKVIIHSFSGDSNSSDVDKLVTYLVELYENSLKTKKSVKYTDLNIDMVEVEKYKEFCRGCG